PASHQCGRSQGTAAGVFSADLCIVDLAPPVPALTRLASLSNSSRLFLHGVQAGLPIAIGYVPIAVAYGALGVASGLTWWHTLLMSLLVFAGASQFMAAGMVAAGAGVVQIIIATFVLNFRHLILSLSLFGRLREISPVRRAALSLGLTDETYAVLIARTQHQEPMPTAGFVVGTMITAYLAWVCGSALGAIFAAVIPADISSGMSVALYAMFIALLMPAARKSAWAALTAAFAMVLCYGFNQFMAPGGSIVCVSLLADY